jgi:phage terminase Nu1 subunit (DNA packaging protein)
MQAGDLPRPGSTAEEYVEAFLAFRLKKFTQEAGGNGLDLQDERARLAHEQADEKAMDNAERRKELASLPDMTGAVIGLISLATARLQQVPSLVAKGDNRLRVRIETAINDALEELSITRVEEATGGGLDDEGARDDNGGGE